MKKNENQNVVIQRPTTARVGIVVRGTSSLIMNAFHQKLIEQMLRKHMGLTTQREKKNPRELIENAIQRNADELPSISPTAFKKAMLSAAASVKTLKKTQLRLAIFVVGQSVPIEYERQIARMDMTRTAGIGRTPDVRFRPEFQGWSARLVIQFDDSTLSVQTVIDLLQRAGSVGVGEWRPEKDGVYGTFEVASLLQTEKEIEEVRRKCMVPMRGFVIPEWALDAQIDPELLRKAAAGELTDDDGEEEAPAPEKKNGKSTHA